MKKFICFLMLLAASVSVSVSAASVTDGEVVFSAQSRELAARMIAAAKSAVNPGGANADSVGKLAAKSPAKSPAERASDLLLGAPYSAAQLSPAAGPERLIAAPERPDCSTFLDSVAAAQIAAKLAANAGGADASEAFLLALKSWRYEGARVGYLQRRHFFSDLAAAGAARDLLAGSALARPVNVRLNASAAGEFIAGLGTRERRLWVLLREHATATALLSLGLQSGDFIGFRREIPGLDVTHVGLILLRERASVAKSDSTADTATGATDSTADKSAATSTAADKSVATSEPEIWLRHASSEHGKVLDVPLLDYLAEHPKITAILLYRPNL